jgi:ABC-type oligopeptide transport system ATPase subunit
VHKLVQLAFLSINGLENQQQEEQQVKAVDDISLEVKKGKNFGIRN